MTIAIALQTGDGVVLGADSASTLGDGGPETQVYFNAEKVWNLHKGLRVGAVTYGLGSLGVRSTASLARDLRDRFCDPQDAFYLDPSSYTVEEVANRVRDYFFTDLYLKEYPLILKHPDGSEDRVFEPMGFLVAGYSAGHREPETWEVEVDLAGVCRVVNLYAVGGYGAEAKGEPEALLRLVNGWSPRILHGMVRAGIPEADAKQFLQSQAMEPLLQAYMPMQDAIDLVRYLAEVTAGFSRFKPGHPTVHEPIDLAAITHHQGFRWVQRKHYYPAALNP